ncbi:glycosyltransferase family 4 protein [Larkinella harenae]
MTFAPDHSGISLYSTDFATYAAEQGHEVTVVTGFSWYPKWEKRPEDKGKLFRTDFYKNIKVLRGYLYIPKKVTALTRILQEITFLIFVFFNFLRAGRHDVIVLFTTPINLGLIGVLFQKIWKSKLIINVQDLQLDAAQSLGMLSKSPIFKIMDKAERYTYREADLVTSISTAMVDIIKQKDASENKVYLWPNWIDVKDAKSKGIPGDFYRKFPQYKGKTIIGYAGNVGVKQSLSSLVDLSEKYKDREDVIFLIIGSGGDRNNLKSYAKQKGATNVQFIDFLSQDDYYSFLCDVDIVFLSQKKDSGDAYFPSKLLGIMAKRKLIFVAAGSESEIYKVVTENELGMSSDITDIGLMQTLLDSYLQDKTRFAQYEANAVAYVHQFDREVVLGALFHEINELFFEGVYQTVTA